jgi:hypothetical protein
MGFWQGGEAPFGMARRIVDENGRPKEILSARQWKSIGTDRVVSVPGSPRTVKTIRLAFNLYTKEHKSRHGSPTSLTPGRMFRGNQRWTLPMLQELLTNLVYKDAYAYGKHEQTSSGSRKLPADKWLVREHAFSAIIPEKQWNEATARMRDEVKPLVDEEMLEALKRLCKRKGKLNTQLINAASDVQSALPTAITLKKSMKHIGS